MSLQKKLAKYPYRNFVQYYLLVKKYYILPDSHVTLIYQLIGWFILKEVKETGKITLKNFGCIFEDKKERISFQSSKTLKDFLRNKYDLKYIHTNSSFYKKRFFYKEADRVMMGLKKCFSLNNDMALSLIKMFTYAIALELKKKNSCTIWGFGRFKYKINKERNIFIFKPDYEISDRIKRMLLVAKYEVENNIQ